MGKVTKILGMLLSAMIMLLIILPFIICLTISLPSIQNFVSKKAAKFASEKIGAKVDVGYINFGPFNRIVVRDFYVEDTEKDTLLYVENLTANLSTINIIKEGFNFHDVDIDGMRFKLRELEDSVLNVKVIVDRITSKKKEKKQIKIDISDAKISNFDFSYERLEHRNPVYGVDYGYIVINDIDAEINDFKMLGQEISANINGFSGRERSGFLFNDFNTHLELESGALHFTDLTCATVRGSSVYMPTVNIVGDDWTVFKDFVNTVQIDGESRRSVISSHDLAFFAPTFECKDLLAKKIDLKFKGVVKQLRVDIDHLEIGDNTVLAGDYYSSGLPEVEDTYFDINISKLSTSASDVNQIVKGYFGEELSPKIQSYISGMTDIDATGGAYGQLSQLNADVSLTSNIGGAEYHGKVGVNKQNVDVSGYVSVENIKVDRILRNDKLGSLSAETTLDIESNRRGVDGFVVGKINRMQMLDYEYSNINFGAKIADSVYDLEVSSQDENLQFDLFGQMNRGKSIPSYDATLRLKHANLHALHVNKRDSVSTLSTIVKATADGASIEDMTGDVTLRNTRYVYNDNQVISTPLISFTGVNSDNSKYISFKSDYVDLSFSSKTNYSDLYYYIRNSMREYLPMLYSDKAKIISQSDRSALANEHSIININFKKISPIVDAISNGMRIADNSEFSLMFNPYNQKFSLRVASNYIEHNKWAAFDLNLNASNQSDSLSMAATAADIYSGAMHLRNYTLMAGARNNVLEIATGFRDSTSRSSATLGLRANVGRDRHIDIDILPSHITYDGDVWNVDALGISTSPQRVEINKFTFNHDNKHIEIDGVASHLSTDSLTLGLRNFDMTMLTPLVSRFGYNIKGRSNGYAVMSSVLEEGRVVANIDLDSMAVNDIYAPPLKVSAGWDAKSNRAKAYVTNPESRDTLIRSYYIPSDVRYYAKLTADNLDVNLISPFLKGITSQNSGRADVDLSILGERRNATLQGGIDVSYFETLIDFTQVKYNIPKAHLDVKDNVISCNRQSAFDKFGNRGYVTMNLDLNHLSNVAYNMRIVPEDMMVLNTTNQDNDLFYGSLFASGVATVKGDKRGVNMDITATSRDNSEFFMPLTSKMSVRNTDFIKFTKPEVVEGSADEIVMRRKLYERKIAAKVAGAININMALHVLPNTDFQLVIDPTVGDIIKARGEGRLNLKIDPQSNIFDMYGDYTITEGNYLFTLQNLINKRFIIDQGSTIQWTGDPLDPLLDIDAVYKLKTSLEPLLNDGQSTRASAVDCIINLSDRLMQPDVSFDIKLPSADIEQQTVVANILNDQEAVSRQFFYLMLANSFIPESSGVSSSIGTTTTAATGFELLTNQLSNWLSSSNYNIVIRYRPESELTSDEVDIGFSKGWIDNRLLIEVEGNYVNDNKASINQNNFSNFMGEAYVTWLIDQAGALRLKGFTQTIDRYDENQGLQETGIGVYYSESFNNFKDLKQQVLERFRRKKSKKSDNLPNDNETTLDKDSNSDEK